MLGFSVFLNENWTEAKEAYVNDMADAGFEGVFTSLHIPEDNGTSYWDRLQPLLAIVQKRRLKLVADISGDALRQIGFSLHDPEAIIASGFSGLRLDDGIGMQTAAGLSHHMIIGLNASTLTENDYAQLVEYGADFNHMIAWHNYYPKPETGLDESWFSARNAWLKAKKFRVAAFAPGDRDLRLPLFETLPTLECHRQQNPFASFLALQQRYDVDDVYIGDPGISQWVYEQFNAYMHRGRLLLHTAAHWPEARAYLDGDHSNRLDVSRDVVRSDGSRSKNAYDTIPPENTVLRCLGSITIDNHLYQRYKGELQITRRELPQDRKVNVIGHILENDLALIDYIQSGTLFTMQSPV
ncbi:MupG family TIM beta-alpha barrel fold protein [Barrientosiimonas marina]|uniref:MupG family TIM beta-alpha barrel fold protein n=1 Tax=Lentibacillus kimchii TaxID=1542911 RepID=A0ABW2UW03_9BACI